MKHGSISGGWYPASSLRPEELIVPFTFLVHTRGDRRVTARSDNTTEFPNSGRFLVSWRTSSTFSYTEHIWHLPTWTSALWWGLRRMPHPLAPLQVQNWKGLTSGLSSSVANSSSAPDNAVMEWRGKPHDLGDKAKPGFLPQSK